MTCSNVLNIIIGPALTSNGIKIVEFLSLKGNLENDVRVFKWHYLFQEVYSFCWGPEIFP